MKRYTLVLTVTLLSAALISAFAEDQKTIVKGKADQSRESELYNLSAAKLYNVQSNDHARLLRKCAATEAELSADVIEEHVKAIRFNTEAAGKCCLRLAKASPENKDLQKRVDQLQERLKKVDQLLKQMDAQAKKGGTSGQAISDESKKISQELKQYHIGINAIDRDFYDSSSDKYYETGKGHFVD